jgi:hypothetical protein
VFLHNCVNAIWNLKGTKCPHFSTFITFLHKKVSITLFKTGEQNLWLQSN